MATYVSPGVYFNEIDLSLYAPQLSTTILAVVGTSPKGPVNTPTFISNVGALTAKFGNPHPDHLAMYSALQFLRYGTQMYFIRVNGPDADKAQVTVKGVASAASLLSSNAGPYTFTDDTEPTATGTNNAATVNITSSNKKLLLSFNGGTAVEVTLAEGTGVTKSTIASEIDAAISSFGGASSVSSNKIVIKTEGSFGSTARLDVLPILNSAYSLLGLASGSYLGSDDTTTIRFISVDRSSGSDVEAHLDVTISAGSTTTTATVSALNTAFSGATFPAAAFNVDGRIKVLHTTVGQNFGLRVDTVNGSNLPYIKGAALILGLTEDVNSFGRGHSPAQDTLTFTAISEGEWGDDLQINVSSGSVTDTFRVTVINKGATVEIFDNLVTTPEAAIPSLRILYIEEAINGTGDSGLSDYITVDDIIADTGYPISGTYSLKGGDDGLESVSDDDYIGIISGSTRTGLQTIADPENIDVNLVIVPGISSAPVINEMIAICRNRGDCMAIIDAPLGLGVQQMVDWHNGAGVYNDHAAFNDSYGALYWPWGKIFDAYNDQYIWTPPTGHVANVYAYTDQVADSWWAPAGLNRGLVPAIVELEFSADQGERDFMYGNQNAINPIVKFNKDGIVVWGQRTLQRKPTALDRVNVRRLILYIRKVLATSVKYFVFEPNDSFTWRSFVGVVDPFLQIIKDRRGLYDFRVVCDETTNTPALIDRGIMRAIVFLKPTKAAEFIQVDLTLTTTGANFEELLF